MKLAYVCTNYNSSADTVRAIESLRANAGHRMHSVIVDNCSRPEQREILERFAAGSSDVDLVLSDTNTGYFGGLNAGLARLLQTRPDLQVAAVGNNDLIFPPDFVASVERNLPLLQRYPVVSPSITTLDGAHQNPHVISGISSLRERLYDLYHSHYGMALLLRWLARHTRGAARRGDEDHHAQAREIWQGHGSCYLLGPRFFEEFGQFWAPTFLFGEEFFLAEQLKRKGYRVYYEPSIALVHACHSSVAQLPSRRHWELSRDAHRIYRRHNPVGSNPPKRAN
jgi:GT2 family glycosyltransferase